MHSAGPVHRDVHEHAHDHAHDRLFERAGAVLGGGGTRSTVFVPPHPPYLAHGQGYEVRDETGHVLIDAQNNYTALVHGHAHPDLVAAAVDALRQGSAFGLPTRSEIDLAEHLTARFPGLERVRFAASGTEAVMIALRAARRFTGRPRVVRFAGCYHGTYDGVAPGAGASPAIAGEVLELPLGDEAALAAALAAHGDEVACVLLDLMPNRAGLRPLDDRFVAAVRAGCDRAGALMVVDEVITARLDFEGLHAAYGVTPDLVTLGKMIGGGLPVGAFGGRADVMAVFDPRSEHPVPHGGTFTANPVTMRAGLAAMRLLDEPAIARLNALGEHLRASLAALGYRVTGRGSLLRIHADDMAAQWWALYRAGVLVGGNGLVALSTPMTDATVDAIVERCARARR